MRITVDRSVDAAYVYLTDAAVEDITSSIEARVPGGAAGCVVLDWDGDRLVGVEVLGASRLLAADLLERAELIDGDGESGATPG